MAYPYDNDDDDGYIYGLNEEQIRARMKHALEDDSDAWEGGDLDFGDLDDEDADDDD
jgi:hypothetical protein